MKTDAALGAALTPRKRAICDQVVTAWMLYLNGDGPRPTVENMTKQMKQQQRHHRRPHTPADRLRALVREDRADPDPGIASVGHFAWSVRQARRDAQKRHERLLND